MIGEGDVLVSVRAAGCGPDVWHLMTGLPYFARAHARAPTDDGTAPRGRDVAGVVEEVGPGVTAFAPGDEVMGDVEGSFAELAVGTGGHARAQAGAASRSSRRRPSPISGCTALQALRDVVDVKPGQRVLVIGAGGGVGTLAVQIAKAFGAHGDRRVQRHEGGTGPLVRAPTT